MANSSDGGEQRPAPRAREGSRRGWILPAIGDWPGKARRSKWLVAVELAAIAAIFAADAHGLIFFSKVPYLLALAWASLAFRGVRWRDVGVRLTPAWRQWIAVGLAAGVAMEALELFVTQPALVALTGAPPDLASALRLAASWKLFVASLALYWVVAALGEELVFRGYLLNRLTDVLGTTRLGWAVALMAGSAIFGLHHLVQGPVGIVENTVDGAFLGGLYLATGRNLVAPIIAHGVTDSLDTILIFTHHYPGL